MNRSQSPARHHGSRLAVLVVEVTLFPLTPVQAAGASVGAPVASTTVVTIADRARLVCPRDRVIVIAHRGTGDGTRTIDGNAYSENTIPAFVKALDEGADGFEADYWPTSDGRIATHHDDTLDRMTVGTGPVAQHTWSQVSALPNLSGAAVPSFEAVARATRPRGGHRQQEIKQGAMFGDRLLRRMVAVDLAHSADAHDTVLYTSSELRTLGRVKLVDARIRVGLIHRSDHGRPALARVPSWVDVILLDLRAADATYVQQAEAAGHEVSVRRVQTVGDLHRAVALGVSRVVTDRPEVLGRAC